MMITHGYGGENRRPLRCGGCVGAVLAGLMLLGWAAPGSAGEPAAEFSRGVLIRFEGLIEPRLQQYLQRKLEIAKQKDADVVIIEIDSPGGLLDTSLEVAQRLQGIGWARTVAYVPQEAISGGAIVALGCDEIVMDTEAIIGDAGPIYQGEDSLFRHAPEKVRDYLRQRVAALAENKGRPVAIAEAMVDMDLVVYHVKNRQTGEETFMSEDELREAADAWEKGQKVTESDKGQFLTVRGRRAVQLKLAQATAAGRQQLRRRYGLTEGLMIIEPSGVDTAVWVLNLPVVTGLLIVIGLVALYVEFSAPGIGLGGLTAGLCFTLFFWSRFLGGTADWLEVILFAAGVVFLLVELLVLPGFGIAGLTGFVLLILSLILASQSFYIPEKSWQLSRTVETLLVLLISGGVFLGAAFALSKYLGEIPILGRIALRPPDAADMAADPEAGVPGHVSRHFGVGLEDLGIADSPLRPAGRARFGDNYIDVVTEGAFLEKGTRLKVIKISGNRVLVRKIEDAER